MWCLIFYTLKWQIGFSQVIHCQIYHFHRIIFILGHLFHLLPLFVVGNFTPLVGNSEAAVCNVNRKIFLFLLKVSNWFIQRLMVHMHIHTQTNYLFLLVWKTTKSAQHLPGVIAETTTNWYQILTTSNWLKFRSLNWI